MDFRIKQGLISAEQREAAKKRLDAMMPKDTGYHKLKAHLEQSEADLHEYVEKQHAHHRDAKAGKSDWFAQPGWASFEKTCGRKQVHAWDDYK